MAMGAFMISAPAQATMVSPAVNAVPAAAEAFVEKATWYKRNKRYRKHYGHYDRYDRYERRKYHRRHKMRRKFRQLRRHFTNRYYDSRKHRYYGRHW